MTRPLRIVVADDEPDMRQYFQRMLPRLGHKVIAAATNGRELVDLCRTENPDLVITDIKMPELDGIEAALEIEQHCPVPIILVSAYHDAPLVQRAEANHILGYLVKPIKQVDLEPSIALAVRRFEEFQALRTESADLRKALEDRKVIEKAKALLMKSAGVKEEEAFVRLQERSQAEKLTLVQAAQRALDAEEPVTK